MELKYNIGDIVTINGSPSKRKVVVGRVANPTGSPFECQYMLMDSSTMLVPTMEMECIMGDVVASDTHSFERLRSYDQNVVTVRRHYATIADKAASWQQARLAAASITVEFELMSERDFLALHGLA